ncbi:MAG: NUDIX hydrolase [Candidatus Nomurabacteria bacterium]|jgi:8-oxo-dGTP diphosphatase|nr:NUDIX hydrolase [Candidatus Nomurabacteria bacterium]
MMHRAKPLQEIYSAEYLPPTLTVDLSLFEVQNDKLCVLLHKRPGEPFQGQWALPGGYVARGETTLQALQKKIQRKTGIDVHALRYLEQSQVFDVVARDPRGHAVSVAYIAANYETETPFNADEVAFFPVDDLPELAYDHQHIIDFGRGVLIDKINSTNLIRAFLSDLFTMSDLQSAYEAVLGHLLDKRNFQKKFFRLNQIIDTGKLRHNTNSRPAKLYKFKTKTIDPLINDLD